MVQKRDVVVAIILSVVTCGIYVIYWFIVMTDDVKTVSGDTQIASGGVAFLLTLVTCGIYVFYWVYRMDQLINIARSKRKLPTKDNAILYIVLQLFGFGIVNYALMQNDINDMITE